MNRANLALDRKFELQEGGTYVPVIFLKGI